METESTVGKDDFYAVVSAIARFIETADSDMGGGKVAEKETEI